jgi:hypothetical protein
LLAVVEARMVMALPVVVALARKFDRAQLILRQEASQSP